MEDEEGRRRREEFGRLVSNPNYFQREVEELESDVRGDAPPGAQEVRHDVQQLRSEMQELRAEVQELRDEVRQLRARLR